MGTEGKWNDGILMKQNLYVLVSFTSQQILLVLFAVFEIKQYFEKDVHPAIFVSVQEVRACE